MREAGFYCPWSNALDETYGARSLNACIPFISLIFPVATTSHTDSFQGIDQFNLHDVLGVFIAELPFNSES